MNGLPGENILITRLLTVLLKTIGQIQQNLRFYIKKLKYSAFS